MRTKPNPRSARSERGLTLIEMMSAIAIASILLVVAVAPLNAVVARMRLEGVANELGTDLQWARSECVRRQVAVSLATTAAGTGYSVSVGNTTLKTVTLPSGVTLAGQVASGDGPATTGAVTIAFDPLRGLANAATIVGSATATNARLQITSDAMGRIRLCSPENSFPGYPSC